MQYYPQNGYFPQPQYVPQPGAYITHYAAAPNVGPPPGVAQPFPAYPQDNYDRFTPSTHHPAPRPKFLQRSQSAAVPNPKAVPLRSAMKKGRHDRSYSQSAVPPSGPVVPTLSRTSSRGQPEQRERANSTGRRRTDSISQTFVPNHLFLTFPNNNDIRVENIAFKSLIDELRDSFLPIWPHGVASMVAQDHVWRATFNGTPWASSGLDFILSRRMICTLFQIFAHEGYSYLATASPTNPPPKLIFVRSEQENIPYFFSVAISQSGAKLSILDAPPQVAENLSNNLRSMFPRKIASDRSTEDGMFVIEVRKGTAGPDVDRATLAAYVLGYFHSLGFKLDGSIPMGKAGALGFGSRKELWVFRAMQQQRPSSAAGHNSVHAPNSAHGHSAHGHGDSGY